MFLQSTARIYMLILPRYLTTKLFSLFLLHTLSSAGYVLSVFEPIRIGAHNGNHWGDPSLPLFLRIPIRLGL
ncbi:hypothetical protein F4820DRAFT_425919 [Hypoxylon rubiginosum]|uniref:Uncharacterized protein n=1 Tax=Hypoxylon rubiginosum TaxID=110542 RepID=A0ACB9YWH0_9PEZI|nr:hypothetical protein F4820DRAFT_425919 [Hypoxylon rubiginosum]